MQPMDDFNKRVFNTESGNMSSRSRCKSAAYAADLQRCLEDMFLMEIVLAN